MKMPEKLPTLAKKQEDLPGLLEKVSSPLVAGEYVHWDKLKYLSPTQGLTHEEWWSGLKLRRAALYRSLPLKDSSGAAFKFGMADPVLAAMAEIDRGLGRELDHHAEIVSPQTRDRYLVNSLIEEAITSSQLEGAAATRVVAKDMIRTGRRPRDEGERMILNNFRAMEFIRTKTDQPLTLDLILALHRVVMADTHPKLDAAGRLRRPDEKITVEDAFGELLHTPPPAEELEHRLRDLCDFANGLVPDYYLPPLVRAIILHFWLAYDHPFVDGNGRTARALFYWSAIAQGYDLFEFISISQIIKHAPVKYGRSFLYSETDDNDLTYFIIYHLDVIRRSLEQLHEYLQKKAAQMQQTEAMLRASVALNHRQIALLGHALRHPDADYTVASHRLSHGVAYDTARTDLLDLAGRKLLVERKVGKSFHFSPAADLENRLRNLR